MGKKIYFLVILFLLSAGIKAQDIVLVDTVITPVSCGGTADGAIYVEVSGGSGNLNYILIGSSVISSGYIPDRSYTFTGLEKRDNYFIYVQDLIAGTQDLFFYANVRGSDPISISNVSTTDINCAGIDDGTITITASGEDGNLIYTLTGPVGASNGTGFFDALPTGTYDVSVTHATCPSSDAANNIFIDVPLPITLSASSVIDVDCFGDNTGEISITPAGGTPPYSFGWTGPSGFTSSSEDLTGLYAGDYDLTVGDANGCSQVFPTITVSENSILTASFSVTNLSCNGGADGAIDVTLGGGVAPYSVSWSGSNGYTNLIDQDITGLSAADYTLTVTDALGCVMIFPTQTVSEPTAISVALASTTPVSCFGGSDGAATINVSGGTGAYTFLWTAAVGPYTSTDEDPVGMPADVYSLQVTDANGCVQLFPNLVTITQPNDITVVVDGFTDVSCFGGNDGTAQITASNGTPGYSYLWTGDGTGHSSTLADPADLVADTYDLQITDANTCVKIFDNLVTIDQPTAITATNTVVDVDCNGDNTGEIDLSPAGGTPPYSFAWTGPSGFTSTNEDITGLYAGTYNVTVSDANGCSQNFTNIVVNENPVLTASFSVTNLSCNGGADGAIDVTLGGGVPPYSVSWSGSNGYTNLIDQDITGLSAADYTLTVTDALGCVMIFPTQTVSEPIPLDVSVVSTDITCFGNDDGTIDITPSNGTAPYGYSWTGPNGFTSGLEDISGLEPGNYSLDLSDASGCSRTFTDLVTIDEPTEILITPTATDISCNGANDGSISITVSGGTPAYTFAWTGPNGFTSGSQDISSLEAGSYDLTITDANTCAKAFSPVATITEPSAILVTFTGQTDLVCFGDSDGTISIDIAGGTAPYVFSWTNSGGQVVAMTEDPVGLPADTYSLEVTDNSSCSVVYADAVTLTEPAELVTTLAKTDIVCAGEINGTISMSSTGGTSPYTYSNFQGGPYTLTSPISGLASGEHHIYTRDANGCTIHDSIDIIEPAAISFDESYTGSILCNGDATVTLTISNVTGGIGPFEYSSDGGLTYQATGTFNSLSAGTYQATVRDVNLCEVSQLPQIITEPATITIDSYSQDDILTCSYAPEGKITISGTGGTGIIQYSLDGGTLQTPGEFINLEAGFYTVNLVDANSCQKDTVVEITAPAEIVINTLSIIDVTGCTGNNNGELHITATGGTGALDYSMDGINFVTPGDFTVLTAGNYTLTVRDGLGCTKDSTVEITEPLSITLGNESVVSITCNGAADGEVSVEASNGTPPYVYTLNPAVLPAQASGTFSGLPAGDYTIQVNDSQGCGPVTSGILSVTEPPAITIDSVVTTTITCNGASDGTISMYISGGIRPYEYSIDNEASYGSDSVFLNLPPANYELFVRDQAGCVMSIGNVNMTDPAILALILTPTDVSPCNGDNNGSINAVASGGWGSYEYSLDGVSYGSSGDFTGLAPNDYTIYVRDAGTCIHSETTAINEPLPVTATVTSTNYVQEILGTITIANASGGTPPYEYAIDGLTGTFTSDTSYADLTAGMYDVVVRDALGCTYEESIEILDIVPLLMEIDSADISCYGAGDGYIEFRPQDAVGVVQYSIDGGVSYTTNPVFENLAGDSLYNLRAYDEDGKIYSGSVYINEPPQLLVYKSVVPAICNAFSPTGSIDLTISGGVGVKTVSWSNGSLTEDLSDIVAGTYVAEIEDENGCAVSDTTELSASVFVNANAGKDTTICSGETLLLNGNAGDVVRWEPSTYLTNTKIYNPVAVRVSDSITYIYTVTETTSGNGCYNVDTLHISTLPVYGIKVSQDTIGLKGQMIQIETETDGVFLSYEWIPSTGLDQSDIPNPVATLNNTVLYILQALNDYGCIESDSMYIEVIENLKIYNAFSPNGDFANEYFEIDNATAFPDILVEVYNRWGTRIFSTVGYSDEKRWDGTINGVEVPVGTYYYIVIPYPSAKPITGTVTIIR